MPDITTQTPDGKKHIFPDGTPRPVIDKAMKDYVAKTKGLGAAPALTPDASPTKKEPAAPKDSVASTAPQASPEHESYFTELSKASANMMGTIQQYRPRWDNPQQMLKEPKWYEPNPAAGAMLLGAGKAVAGGAVGGVKMLSDLMSSLDPRELYQPTGKAQEVGSDVKDTVYGIGHMTKDLLLHFPELAQDPEKLGNTLMSIAMTVDGGVKGASAITEHLFPDAAGMTADAVSKTGAQTAKQQALWAASQASKANVSKALSTRGIEDAYIHKNGVGVAQDFVNATKEAEKEDKIHTDNLARIDTKIPSGVIDASQEAQTITKEFADVVKTPDPMNKSLSQMVKDAVKVAPGQWTYVKAMQFRTSLGRAMQSVTGPQYAVMSRVYGDLTRKLGSVAKQYGLEDSWNQHNNLAAKMNKSFPLIEKARQILDENGEGMSMAQALKSDAATKEVVKSLSKYGLDADKVLRYSAKADKIIRERPSQNQRLTSYIYKIGPGTGPALTGYIAGHAAGTAMGAGSSSYIMGLGAGAMAGWATVNLVHTLRAMRLAPEILDSILDKREWPDKLKPPSGNFPQETSESEAPTGPQALPPAPESPAAPQPTAKASTLPTPEAPVEAKAVPTKITNKAKAAQVKAEIKATEPKVTKVPEGEHGTGKIARAAKQQERVAKVRSVKGSTALGGGTQEISGGDVAGEIAKAQTRVEAPEVNLSKLTVAEMEPALQKLDPAHFKELQQLRKKISMSASDYEEGLRSFLFIAYEKALKEPED